LSGVVTTLIIGEEDDLICLISQN